MKCKNCGLISNDDSPLCKNCGASFAEKESVIDKNTSIVRKRKIIKKEKSNIEASTTLVILDKCKNCINKCKVESLPHAVLIGCPDYKPKN